MGKRASVTGKGAGSPAKAAKVAPSTAKSLADSGPTQDDPLYEVYRVLKARCDTATADMLVASLPLALKEVDGTERHSFQDKMLDAAAKELADAVSGQKAMVDGLTSKAGTLEEEKAQSATVAADITARLAQKKADCESTEEAMKIKEVSLAEADAAFAAAKASSEAADGEKQEMQKKHDDFAAGLTELFQPLKAYDIPGNKWRERNQKVEKLAKKFQEAGAEESLVAAVQAVMKIKGDARGEFAQAAIEHAEERYTAHIEELKGNIDDFGAEISKRATAVSEAEAVAKEAKEAFDSSCEENIAAQNAWADVTNEELAHKEKVEAFGTTSASLQEELEAAKAELARLEAIVSTFVSRRAGKPPAADAEAVPAGEAAAEA